MTSHALPSTARRTAVLLAVAGALVAGTARPGEAAVVTSAVCQSFDTSVPGAGIKVSMPTVDLSPGEQVYVQAWLVGIDGQQHAGNLFYTEYGWRNWLTQKPAMLGGGWMQDAVVGDTSSAALSLPAAGLTARAYIGMYVVARGQWEWTSVPAPDGGEWCRS